jgi:hypothetical protein
MTQVAVAVILVLLAVAGCAEPMSSSAQTMTDEQRCANSGGMWRGNSICEQPSVGRGGRR